MTIKRYAAKRDGNESDIIDALKGVGASVMQLDKVDLVVGFRGSNFLLEVKAEKGTLEPSQEALLETWEGQYAIVRSVADALRVIGAIS